MCIWCRLQSKSIYSHVSTSCKLQMGHVFEGNLCIPKINCVMVFPMYWLFLNSSMFVFCESINSRLFQKSLDISLSMMGFMVHLLMLGKSSANIYRLFSRLYFFMNSTRHLTGPL